MRAHRINPALSVEFNGASTILHIEHGQQVQVGLDEPSLRRLLELIASKRPRAFWQPTLGGSKFEEVDGT